MYSIIKPLAALFFTAYCAFIVYDASWYIGFRDGHMTEFGRFVKTLFAPIFLSACGVFATIFLTFILKRKNLPNIILVAYALFILASIGIYQFYASTMENGSGG